MLEFGNIPLHLIFENMFFVLFLFLENNFYFLFIELNIIFDK